MVNIIVPDSSELTGNPNSVSSPVTTVVPQCAPAKYWCFVLNNYQNTDIDLFKKIPSSKVPRLVFQEEIGENGTPHLQGALMFKTKGRPFTLLPHRRTHWENKMKNSTVPQLFNYACKKDTRVGEIYARGWELPYELTLKELFYWEKDIIGELKLLPDDRKINWIWESEGGVGKTTFQKWIFCNYQKVVVLSGKASDMKNGIINYQAENGYLPTIVLINVPRSNIEYLSFQGIEEIKDMFFFSGKYEGGMVCNRSPHVYIFANSAPDKEKMSKDRWKVRQIHGGRLYQTI